MLTKRLVEVFGKNYVVKRSGGSFMLVVRIAVARLLAEDRLVSGLPILKKGGRLAIGKATLSFERTISKPSSP
jgi:hypothetical protein